MKTLIQTAICVLILTSATSLRAQQQPELLNLPGDNLNLYAVMKIFQESETLELFEQKLNEEDSRINNLDLNGDNYIDYIKVVDYVEKNVHYIILQVAVSPNENQDVAVFVVKKDSKGEVNVQLIGDEELYGKYYIVEPYYDDNKGSTPNPGYYGNQTTTQTVVVQRTTYYEVASWPLITYIFLPTYVVWHSPYYWGYYPTYWRPWTPWYYHEYYGYHYHWHYHYYGHYRHGSHYHHDGWHDTYYTHHRKTSPVVHARRDRGDFNTSYSRPDLMSKGSERFKRENPKAPTVNETVREPRVRDTKAINGTNDRRTQTPAETRQTRPRETGRQINKPMNERQATQRPSDRQVKPERPTTRQEQPQVKPERPTTRQEQTQVKPERQTTRQEQPQVKQERNTSRSEQPQVKPERQTRQAERPQVKQERKPENKPAPKSSESSGKSTSKKESKTSESGGRTKRN